MMIAIDGPAGAGKSEISRGLAAKLGFAYLDTGAMYRAIGLKAMRLGAPLDEESSLAAILDNTALEVHCSVNGAPVILLDGENVTETLRRQDVGDAASHVSALPVVRAWLLDKQRTLAASGNVIMDGRDIGTQVLPNAEVKIYLTASPKVRAQRRVDQLKEKGQNADYDAVLREVCERDERDMNRAISPLRRADDAHLVDSSDMTIPEVVAAIMKYVNKAEAKADDADI